MSRFPRSTAIALALALAAPATAHDVWQDGKPVPAWVKHSCCGEADAHHLKPEQVHDQGDYYIVDGYGDPIPKYLGGKWNSSILPSQDGDYWIFYGPDVPAGPNCGGPEAPCSGWHDAHPGYVYCFFVPEDM